MKERERKKEISNIKKNETKKKQMLKERERERI